MRENIILDLGANIECTHENLIQFAIMGSEFAKIILGKEKPRIGILNVGTEQEKGKIILQDVANHLKKSYLSKQLYVLHFHINLCRLTLSNLRLLVFVIKSGTSFKLDFLNNSLPFSKSYRDYRDKT